MCVRADLHTHLHRCADHVQQDELLLCSASELFPVSGVTVVKVEPYPALLSAPPLSNLT